VTPPDPKEIKLKTRRTGRIAGKPLKRLDTADKLNGSKVYAIDVKLPGMLQRRNQGRAGVSARSSSASTTRKAAKMPGVKKIMKVGETAVAVIGRHLVARQNGAFTPPDHPG